MDTLTTIFGILSIWKAELALFPLDPATPIQTWKNAQTCKSGLCKFCWGCVYLFRLCKHLRAILRQDSVTDYITLQKKFWISPILFLLPTFILQKNMYNRYLKILGYIMIYIGRTMLEFFQFQFSFNITSSFSNFLTGV